MKYFHNSWRNFLNENIRTEDVPFKDTRIRIKLENDEKLLREVTEDEFEHIQRAIDELSFEDLAFHNVFGDKTRLVIDFPTADEQSELGRFLKVFSKMGYEVDWAKGILSAERKYIDTSPDAVEAIMAGLPGSGMTVKKINMKVGKWISKVYNLILKKQKLDIQIREYLYTNFLRSAWSYLPAHYRAPGSEPFEKVLARHIESGELRNLLGPDGEDWGSWEPPYVTRQDIEKGLGSDASRIKQYYRIEDTIKSLTMSEYGAGRSRITAQYIELLKNYWQNNADYIKKNIKSGYSNQYSIIITRDPVDVWRMSDFDNITSCHSPPSRGGEGDYYKCAVAEAHGHGAVAYVVFTEDLLKNTDTDSIDAAEEEIQDGEIFGDTARSGGAGFDIEPQARLRLRQLRYYEHNKKPEEYEGRNPFEGTQLAVPEKRVYGARIPGFYTHLLKWAKEVQKTEIERAPWIDGKLNFNDFIKFGGSYDDNPMSLLLMSLFNVRMKDTEGHVKQDKTTEDDLDDNLIGSLQQQYQNRCDEVTEYWNSKMGWTMANAMVEDDGAGSVYISVYAEIRIKWDPHEWVNWMGMPGLSEVTSALDEVKEYGLDWVKSDYPYTINKAVDGAWQLPIDVEPTQLVEFGGEGYAYDPDNYEEFCRVVNSEVDNRYDTVKQILTNFFKREGYIEGGAIMALGREIINDEMDLYHWEAEAEEGYEVDEFELVQFTTHPEVWYADLGATEEQAMKIMNDRNFWLEIRKRMAAPAFKNTKGSMYPQMPLDMDMFGMHGTEGESQELNLQFSVHDDAPDEQVNVLKNLVEIWDDQDEINKVANEVFRDMLKGVVKRGNDETPIGSLPGDWSVSENNKREELNALKIERMLSRLSAHRATN